MHDLYITDLSRRNNPAMDRRLFSAAVTDERLLWCQVLCCMYNYYREGCESGIEHCVVSYRFL